MSIGDFNGDSIGSLWGENDGDESCDGSGAFVSTAVASVSISVMVLSGAWFLFYYQATK